MKKHRIASRANYKWIGTFCHEKTNGFENGCRFHRALNNPWQPVFHMNLKKVKNWKETILTDDERMRFSG
jgi:hypothetical protein